MYNTCKHFGGVLHVHLVYMYIHSCPNGNYPHTLRGTLEFSVCMDLKNPWNDSKPVKISRDGQVHTPSLSLSGLPLTPFFFQL